MCILSLSLSLGTGIDEKCSEKYFRTNGTVKLFAAPKMFTNKRYYGACLASKGDSSGAKMEWRAGGWVGSGAGSYSHLRAHETVLDLVCRLLL